MINRPLNGIRVLDFGRFIAGPYCGTLLADFGADVIRIERREGGEDRRVAPITETGEGPMFLNLNRNKKGFTLDPSHPESGEIKRRLISSADVVIANLPMNVLERLGLGYETLREIRPDIILTRISTFGHEGPYRDRVGFDPVIQAMSGAMTLTGFSGPPVKSVVNFEDFGTALHAAFGTMVALFERQRTGHGRIVDASLLSTGIMFMQTLLAERYVTGIVREQQGNTGYHAAPSDSCRTRDGWIFIHVIGNAMFRRWAKVVGAEHLIDDPRCKDDQARSNNNHLITEAMNRWASGLTTAEAMQKLEASRVPCGKVYTLDEVFEDPQIQARKLFDFHEFPGCERDVPLADTPVRLSETPPGIRHRAPMLGEHTDLIMKEIGFNDDQIKDYRRKGVI
ncbi:MAG: CoA transferase [Acidobacteriota bacterium]|nr:MAG: CoA transferase [Acidobacteriota bacterium]